MMKKLLLPLLLALTVLLPSAVSAQGFTPVSIPPDALFPVVKYATNATSNTTLTIAPQSGGYLYIQQISITNCAGAAVTGAAPLSITSTNLGGGTTPAWTVGTAGTAGMCNPVEGYIGAQPMKSNTPGTAVTFVLPTFTTNQVLRINVFYFEWPR